MKFRQKTVEKISGVAALSIVYVTILFAPSAQAQQVWPDSSLVEITEKDTVFMLTRVQQEIVDAKLTELRAIEQQRAITGQYINNILDAFRVENLIPAGYIYDIDRRRYVKAR